MANSEIFTLHETASTEVFHGQGTVVLQPMAGQIFIGGSDVSAENGFLLSARLEIPVGSQDRIFAIAGTGSEGAILSSFSCR